MSETAITVTTVEGEVITYFRAESGYWMATQEGMPDHWGLSRVASRALDEVVRLRSALSRQTEALEDSKRLDWLDGERIAVRLSSGAAFGWHLLTKADVPIREAIDAARSVPTPPGAES